MKKFILSVLLGLGSLTSMAEEELIKFGDFDSWITRSIKESVLVGGNTQTLYEVGPKGTFDGARASPIRGDALGQTAMCMPRWQAW